MGDVLPNAQVDFILRLLEERHRLPAPQRDVGGLMDEKETLRQMSRRFVEYLDTSDKGSAAATPSDLEAAERLDGRYEAWKNCKSQVCPDLSRLLLILDLAEGRDGD